MSAKSLAASVIDKRVKDSNNRLPYKNTFIIRVGKEVVYLEKTEFDTTSGKWLNATDTIENVISYFSGK
ncbi:MAG: hypothetical protein GY828_03180 [Candidatus Gracilibacteria bacterium]|nr:hypothetical protein [Candidatus Gracilibacteria bacterium]